jgi:protoheme IX farnesyltransferase
MGIRSTDYSMFSDIIFPLIRLRMALAVTGAAMAGLLLAEGFQAGKALTMTAGVFLLAACGSILNQVQERRRDALMARTCRRPLPAGRLSPPTALLAAVLAGGGGFYILMLVSRNAAAAGVLALFFYNALYTPLKRCSFLALLPGALCGSMAPAIGWLSGGGRPEDHRMVLICGLLFLWQIPHFWLFALRHRHDMARAGLFPGLPMASRSYARGLIFVWMFALLAGTLLLPALKVAPLLPLAALCLAAAAWPIRQFWFHKEETAS